MARQRHKQTPSCVPSARPHPRLLETQYAALYTVGQVHTAAVMEFTDAALSHESVASLRVAMANGHHNKLVQIYHYVFLPYAVLAVLYMPFSIWEHLRYFAPYIVNGYWPLIIGATVLLILICRCVLRTYWQLGPPITGLEFWIFALGFAVGAAGTIWNEVSARQIPTVKWTRLDAKTPFTVPPDDAQRYVHLTRLLEGRVQPEDLMSALDLRDLTAAKECEVSSGPDGNPEDINYIVLESNAIRKCPAHRSKLWLRDSLLHRRIRHS